VPKVKEEIKSNSILWLRFELAMENGKIEIKTPIEKYKIRIKETANKIGDSYLLSEADLDLLAIALELKAKGIKPKIVTDDYSIQNVASQMKIEFIPLATRGIQRVFEWIRYCPACYKKYLSNFNSTNCSVCGTKLKRKPKKKIGSRKVS
jgi:UPF0271 protein